MPCYLALLIGVAMTVVHSSSALEGRYFLSLMFLSDIVICNAHSNAVMCKNLRYKLRLGRKSLKTSQWNWKSGWFTTALKGLVHNNSDSRNYKTPLPMVHHLDRWKSDWSYSLNGCSRCCFIHSWIGCIKLKQCLIDQVLWKCSYTLIHDPQGELCVCVLCKSMHWRDAAVHVIVYEGLTDSLVCEWGLWLFQTVRAFVWQAVCQRSRYCCVCYSCG